MTKGVVGLGQLSIALGTRATTAVVTSTIDCVLKGIGIDSHYFEFLFLRRKRKNILGFRLVSDPYFHLCLLSISQGRLRLRISLRVREAWNVLTAILLL